VSGVKLLDYWSPPDGSGEPLACLATSFTFEADFFTQDCLSRFLSLSTVEGEGDRISSIVAVLEEEEKLSETRVSVLVDRSSPAEKRNLRWDVLPVGVPGGLLHAKVAVLLWERATRIVVGSANLTAAGYRRQIELSLAIDLDDGSDVPAPLVADLVAELRNLVGLVPASLRGPRERALETIALLEARAAALGLPARGSSDLRLAVAPARPGLSPLDRVDAVWRGGQPLWATVVSPFWDDVAPAPALRAIRMRLTGRPAHDRSVTLVAAVDPFTGSVQAPASLASQDADLVAFDPPDTELRSLHAKLLILESREWLAALIGSSNATTAGYGLSSTFGHHELNVWVGCPARSKTAKHLRSLARLGEPVELTDIEAQPLLDEDEPTAAVLPPGFVSCLIDAANRQALFTLEESGLPTSWEVHTPAGLSVLSDAVRRASSPKTQVIVDLPDELLPPYFHVRWDGADGPEQATWIANVEDRGALPPPAELRELPVNLLLAALASSRPLPLALEAELRRAEGRAGATDVVDLDPLRRFDDSSLLLQRTRHLSLALWRLQERLQRPASNLDALHWRLYGSLGPIAIADGLVVAARGDQILPGEAHFLLAELALTVAAVDWRAVTGSLTWRSVATILDGVLDAIDERRRMLPPAPHPSLDAYVRDALIEARR
jgi:hypothetical protein